MLRRNLLLPPLVLLVMFAAGCHKNKSVNPIANLDSKQPDKVLFDNAMDALKRNKFDVARITLQTLINTYPDSEYIARAKLAVGDAWYEEGGATGLAQAEAEYKDFETFFPNMPEAAEAQLKVAGIHYKQMQKPDRDFTHAKRAEDEYRALIQQYPDSKLVPEAKKRLLEVQEVLAEREYRIGRFYFLRESWPAAIARLRSLTDSYPLYSQADEALFLLAQSYESELNLVRANNRLQENIKTNLINDFTKQAASSYAKIITRYPAMNRAKDARERLAALRQPVPEPTPQALAQNKAEEASREETGRFGRMMMNFKSRPDVAQAVKVGDPTMDDPKPTNATDVVKDFSRAATGTSTATIESVKGAPGENQPVPRSDSGSADQANPAGTQLKGDESKTDESNGGTKPDASNAMPGQVNDAAGDNNSAASTDGDKKASSSSDQKQDDSQESSSKKKKKKKK